MSCCPILGTPPKDAGPSKLATKSASICQLCATDILANTITVSNLNVESINNVTVTPPSSVCVCSTSTYTPSVISFTGFSSGVNPVPALISRLGNIITITGIVVATNTGVNNWATAELSLPPLLPIGSNVTVDYVRGSGSYWNQNVDVVTGIVLPVHVQAVTSTTFRICVNQLLTDGAMSYTLQYQTA